MPLSTGAIWKNKKSFGLKTGFENWGIGCFGGDVSMLVAVWGVGGFFSLSVNCQKNSHMMSYFVLVV
jgi:hypothetical protein